MGTAYGVLAAPQTEQIQWPSSPCLDPSRFAQVHQLDPLAPQVVHFVVTDLEGFAAPVALAQPPQHRHRHREAQVLVLGDPAFVGQVEVGQGQGVNGHAPGLTVGGITRMFGDVALGGIDPQGTDAGGFIGPQVIAGDVEGSPVGVEPVARYELPERHHVVPGQVESTGAGLPGKTTTGRGRHAALVDPVAWQEPLIAEDAEGVRRPVPHDDAADVLVAPPQQLFFFSLDQPGVFLLVQFRAGRSGPGQSPVQPLDDFIQRGCGFADDLVDGRAVGKLGGFFRPVLGEQRHQPIRQVGLHFSQQFSEGSRAGGLDHGSDCSRPAGSPG